MIYHDLKVDKVKLIEEAMNSASMTKGVGDSQFMSLEMINDLDYDSKTDVFSFGILAYLIFAGELPRQAMKEKSMGKPIILPEESQFISAACIELMSMCLMEDPKERPSFDGVLKFIRDSKFMLASDVDPSIVSQRDKELELIKNA